MKRGIVDYYSGSGNKTFTTNTDDPYRFSGMFLANDGAANITITFKIYDDVNDSTGKELVITIKPNETFDEDFYNGTTSIAIAATDNYRAWVRADYNV